MKSLLQLVAMALAAARFSLAAANSQGSATDFGFAGKEIYPVDNYIDLLHAADINGDGKKDIVTGKRFFAHNGADPGAYEPVMMYWYDIKRQKGKQPEFVRHAGRRRLLARAPFFAFCAPAAAGPTLPRAAQTLSRLESSPPPAARPAPP